MNSKLIRSALVSAAFAGVIAACGSDGGSDTADTTVRATTEVAAENGEGAGSGETSANPDVVAYCESADELATELKEVMADPANADVATVTAKATDLTAKAADLISASPADMDEINACSARLTEAVTPAG